MRAGGRSGYCGLRRQSGDGVRGRVPEAQPNDWGAPLRRGIFFSLGAEGHKPPSGAAGATDHALFKRSQKRSSVSFDRVLSRYARQRGVRGICRYTPLEFRVCRKRHTVDGCNAASAFIQRRRRDIGEPAASAAGMRPEKTLSAVGTAQPTACVANHRNPALMPIALNTWPTPTRPACSIVCLAQKSG